VTFPRFRQFADVETFRFPLPSRGRLAFVDTHLRGSVAAANFASTDLAAMEAFAPESIVLPLSTALSYAMQRLAGASFLPSLRCAIVVLSSLSTPGGPMTDDNRDLLWRAFGLPVFEQFLGEDGRVVASECEVHDGLHMNEAGTPIAGEPAGYSAEIVTGHCYCGLETPRLRNIVRVRERAAAAAA
jgi:hypothetical protein